MADKTFVNRSHFVFPTVLSRLRGATKHTKPWPDNRFQPCTMKFL
uniref:Uncharacterized protein n=1 Tax=Arundo donax TaxID=35708 RepID=A0A0A9EIN2_ARUDO